MDCIFCKISSGEIDAEKMWETEDLIAFKDHSPSADTHVLIVPKKHVESFLALDDGELLDKMRVAAQKVIRDLKLESAYRLVLNGGKYQHVPHLHWHLLGGELKKPGSLPE